MQLEQITVRGVREYSGLDEASVEGFYRAENNVLPLVKDSVITPFEELLKESTGHDSDNLPNGEQETSTTLGDVTFTVTSRQRTKRPRHADVYDGLVGFLEFVQESHGKDVRRKDVVTIEGQGYIALSEITDKATELTAEVEMPEVTHSLS